MRYLMAALLNFCCLAHFVPADETDVATEKPAVAEKETIQFGDDTLALAYEANGEDASIKEYVPADETLDNWTKLVAIREFRNIDDAKEYAAEFVKTLEARDPPAPYELLENDKTGDLMLDFIVWPEDGAFVEFNLFRIQPGAEGGVLASQYALRAYGDDAEPFVKGMTAEKRAELIALLLNEGKPLAD